MPTPDVSEALLELVRRTATDLPEDVEAALEASRDREDEGSAARNATITMLDNVTLARERSTPICQDTGTPIFYVYHPEGWSQRHLAQQIRGALAKATELAYLRPNAVDPVTGKNTGDNVGDGYPTIHFEEWDESHLKVNMMLKGGGCENVSAQYSLPNAKLGAGRDLDGVRKVVLDAAYQAQGKGCAPGVLGVAVGGDRGVSYTKAKEQLFRKLDEPAETEELRELENRIMEQVNQLGIGPMGFGGKTTVMGVQVTAPHRHPASFFVTVAYMCWADRRRTLEWRDGAYSVA